MNFIDFRAWEYIHVFIFISFWFCTISKGASNQKQGKTLFSMNDCGKNLMSTSRTMKLYCCSTLYAKITPNKFNYASFGNEPKMQATKRNQTNKTKQTNKKQQWDQVKLKICKSKENKIVASTRIWIGSDKNRCAGQWGKLSTE